MQRATSTILVLEPDVIVRSEISDFLRRCGYEVIEGVSAQDFVDAISSGKSIDLVLSEVVLAGSTTGFQLAHSVRQTMPEIGVILVFGAENAVAKADDLCERGPVRKPYRPEDILRRIRELGQNHRKQGRLASKGWQ